MQKTILITGGTSGLGLEFVKKYIEVGARVFVVSQTEGKLANLRNMLGGKNLTTLTCDISSPSDVTSLARELKELDVLINNAGIIVREPLATMPDEKILTTINTNLTGTILVTKYLLPLLLKSPSGVIVNISSSAGQKGRANHTVYAATKYGVRGFTESLNDELYSTSARAMCVFPGGFASDLYKSAHIEQDLTKFMNPSDIVNALYTLIEAPKTLSIESIVINRGKFE